MHRDRILIWLFIAATVAVDLVAHTVAESVILTEVLLVGFVLGQVGALAIWAGNRGIHRLARAAWLVIITGILAWVIDPSERDPPSEWLALLSGYALIAWAMNLLIKFAYRQMNRASPEWSSEQRWQIPLIEIFGWTVVVAVASFGARHMTFGIFDADPTTALAIAAFCLVPLGVSLLFHGTRASWYRHIAKALCWIGVSWLIGAAIVPPLSGLETILSIQAAYLVAWMIVVSPSGPISDQAQSDELVEESGSASPQTRLRIQSED